MRLTSELLLAYQGFHGMDGIAHVRVYEEPGQIPVVVAGQLDDKPGTHLTTAVEMVAASIHENLFRDGREFRLVSYEPRDMFGNSWFRLIEFEHGRASEAPDDPAHYTGAIVVVNDTGERVGGAPGTEKHGDFRNPRWHHLDDPAELVGCEIRTWSRGEYTAAALFGSDGEVARANLAANTREIGDRLSEYFED